MGSRRCRIVMDIAWAATLGCHWQPGARRQLMTYFKLTEFWKSQKKQHGRRTGLYFIRKEIVSTRFGSFVGRFKWKLPFTLVDVAPRGCKSSSSWELVQVITTQKTYDAGFSKSSVFHSLQTILEIICFSSQSMLVAAGDTFCLFIRFSKWWTTQQQSHWNSI